MKTKVCGLLLLLVSAVSLEARDRGRFTDGIRWGNDGYPDCRGDCRTEDRRSGEYICHRSGACLPNYNINERRERRDEQRERDRRERELRDRERELRERERERELDDER